MKYVSVHHHSTFSYGDGFGTPRQHVDRAMELGMTALALTEHGNVSSHVQLEKACKAVKKEHDYDLKPLFGCELYTGPSNMRDTQNTRKWHQTVLAMDQEGYVNLNEMVSRSWSEGFYRWPTVTGDILRDHARGIISTSGCSDSLLACTLLGGKGIPVPARPNIGAARNVIHQFVRLFGDRYYLEAQQFPELERTCTLNAIYEELSQSMGVPLVASSDCHYPYPADNEMQKILHAASRNTGTVAAAEAGWEYGILLTLPESDEYILDRLIRTGLTRSAAIRSIENTAVIAERCNVILPKSERLVYPGTVAELTWS